MDAIFINSKNNKTPDPHIPLINPSEKKKIQKEVINMLLYQILQ